MPRVRDHDRAQVGEERAHRERNPDEEGLEQRPPRLQGSDVRDPGRCGADLGGCVTAARRVVREGAFEHDGRRASRDHPGDAAVRRLSDEHADHRLARHAHDRLRGHGEDRPAVADALCARSDHADAARSGARDAEGDRHRQVDPLAEGQGVTRQVDEAQHGARVRARRRHVRRWFAARHPRAEAGGSGEQHLREPDQ